MNWFLIACFGHVSLPDSVHALVRLKSLETQFVSYVHGDPPSNGNGLAEGHLVLEGRHTISPGVDVFLQPEIWADNLGLSSGAVNQVHDRAVRRPSVNLSEGYVDVRGAWLDLRLGKQKIAWGKADGLNPTDVFGAFDYADLLHPERLGVVGLRTFYFSDPGRGENGSVIEGIFVPWYSSSRAGRISTRWRPILEDGSIPVGVDVRYPSAKLSNANAGLKFSREVSGWDVSILYARLIDDVAGGERLGGPFVRPSFLKKRVAGMDASRTIDEGRWEIHAEAAHTATPSGLDDDFVQAVVGARRTFPDLQGESDFDLTLEWAWEHVYSAHKEDHVVVVNRIQRPFPGSVLVRAVWKWNEFVSWTVRGAYTVRGADAYVVMNELAWRVTDLLELRAGFDALSGRGGRTIAGQYEENDRWNACATIYFR